MTNTSLVYTLPDEGVKTAVCVLYEKDGLFLSVSRKDDPTDFGLPGGKLDEGETLIQCAIRELSEETRYLLQISPWNPFMMIDENGMFTITFKATALEGVGKEVVFSIDEEKETGVVSFVDKEELCKGSFGSYNQAMLNHFGY